MILKHKDTYYYGAKTVIFLFLTSIIISYLYALVTGKYNGDFLGINVEINNLLLFINFIISIIPFAFLWFVYLYYKKKTINMVVQVPYNFFELFFFVIIIWHIAVTFLFGVGIMTGQISTAPTLLKPLLFIMNRFQPVYVGVMYILICRNKRKEILAIALILLIGISRAGLGFFLYIAIALLIKYNVLIISYIKKHLFVVIIALLLFPFFVDLMFNIRNQLRTKTDVHQSDLTSLQLITGKLFGRLSSFSNSAIMLQEPAYFYLAAQSLNPYYFQLQVLGGLFGAQFIPNEIPERQLINMYSSENNGTYMCGTQGNLIISMFKSPYILLLNIITILVLVIITFKIIRLLNIPLVNELALILLAYPIMSGVGNEFSFLLANFIMVFLVCLCLSSISKYGRLYNLK